MSDLEELIEAFQLVNKYEDYTLVKALGVILIVFGVAHFFYSWINSVFFFPSFYLLRGIIADIVLVVLILFTAYNYLSLRKTVIKNKEILSSRFVYFGLSLVILYSLTFVVDLLFYGLAIDIYSLISLLVKSRGSIFLLSFIFNILFYSKDAIGVFSIYFILKKNIKSSNFEELIILTFVSLVTSTVIHMLLFASILLFTFIPILFLSATLVYSSAFILSGLYSIKKAYSILRNERNVSLE
ncbi:MAG: hypothetical protein ACFFBD_27210 [Candidatus Hodarchaeota archaeon]